MKSFRLDFDSVKDTIDSWPAIIVSTIICGLLAYFGWFDPTRRITLVVFAALYFGYALRGSLTQSFRAKYANASYLSLLSIGMCSATFGVLGRMIFPAQQGGLLDYVWLAISFTTILAFVLVNRRDTDVVQ